MSLTNNHIYSPKGERPPRWSDPEKERLKKLSQENSHLKWDDWYREYGSQFPDRSSNALQQMAWSLKKRDEIERWKVRYNNRKMDEFRMTAAIKARTVTVLKTGKRPLNHDSEGSKDSQRKEPRLEVEKAGEDKDEASDGEGDVEHDGRTRPFQQFSQRTQQVLRTIGRPYNTLITKTGESSTSPSAQSDMSRRDNANTTQISVGNQSPGSRQASCTTQSSSSSSVAQRLSAAAFGDSTPDKKVEASLIATTRRRSDSRKTSEETSTDDDYLHLSGSFGLNDVDARPVASEQKEHLRAVEPSPPVILQVETLTESECIETVAKLLTHLVNKDRSKRSEELTALKTTIQELESKLDIQEQKIKILETSGGDQLAALQNKIEEMAQERHHIIQRLDRHEPVIQAFSKLVNTLHPSQQISTSDEDCS